MPIGMLKLRLGFTSLLAAEMHGVVLAA